MKAIALIILVLIVAIFYIEIKKYKKIGSKEEIPKKIINKLNETKNNPEGVSKMVQKIKESFYSEQVIEDFTDIKDIRYGKIGCNNCPNGESRDKWIKIAKINLNGAWTAKGFTLEVYPRIKHHSSAKQTIVCLVRNTDRELDQPYINLNTHNESYDRTKMFRDIKAVRVGGSGISNNIVEIWGQMDTTWGDTTYCMFYLYSIQSNDEIIVTQSPMQNTPPGGQSWGIDDLSSPEFEYRYNDNGVRKTLKNTSNGANAYTLHSVQNATGAGSYWFLNGANRNDDGGKNTATIRNDAGDMRVQGTTPWNEDKGLIVKADSGNVGVNTKNPRNTMEVNGDLRVTGKVFIGNTVLKPEGNYLAIDKEDGRRIMLITPDWDKIQIYRDSNGQRPYLYYNKNNGHGIW